MPSKTAIITGASSQDGRTLAHFLLQKDYTVILTYRSNTQLNLGVLKSTFAQELTNNPLSRLFFEVCDITDKNSVQECIKSAATKFGKIDELYLLASLSHVGNSFNQKDYSILANGQSYYFFLDSLKNFSPTTRVFGALTSELVGNCKVVSEDSPWAPRNPYAIGKALGGHWINYYREAGIFACSGILFGHSNYYRSDNFAIRKITSTAAKIAAGKEKTLTLASIKWSKDESWADFVMEAAWRMLQNEKPEDYVIGNGTLNSCEEHLEYAFNFFNLKWQSHVIVDDSLKRPKESMFSVADCRKAIKDLCWVPNRITFKEHIEKLCNFDLNVTAGLNPEPEFLFS